MELGNECVSYFSYSYEQIHDKQLKRWRVYIGSRFEGIQSIRWGKVEHEVAAFLFLQSETPAYGMVQPIFMLRVFPPGLYFSGNTLIDTHRTVFSRRFYNDQHGLLSFSLFSYLVAGWRRQRKGFLTSHPPVRRCQLYWVTWAWKKVIHIITMGFAFGGKCIKLLTSGLVYYNKSHELSWLIVINLLGGFQNDPHSSDISVHWHQDM